MEKREFLRNFLAGMFVIVGILLTIGFIATIGKSKGFAEPKFTMNVLFRNVGGLSEGAPVRLSGVNIGTVARISFLQKNIMDKNVAVAVNILSKFRPQFNNGLNFKIKTEGILGEKFLEISIVEGMQKFDLNGPIMGEEPLDIQDIAQTFGDAAESFTRTSDELSKIDLMELAQVMSDSSKALLVTSEGLNAVMSDLKAVAKKSKRLFDRIELKVIEGDLFKIF